MAWRFWRASSRIGSTDARYRWLYLSPRAADASYGDELLSAALRACDAPLKTGRGRFVALVRGSTGPLFAKYFLPVRGMDRVRRLLAGPRAVREARTVCRAEERGVPLARVAGLARATRCKREEPEWVILFETGEDWRRVTQLWRCADATPAECVSQRGIITAVARLFAAAHDAGFVHRDAHPDNIMLVGAGNTPRALFVDVLGARLRTKPLDWTDSARSLAQLYAYAQYVTRPAERARFLVAYLRSRQAGAVRPGRLAARTLAQQIDSVAAVQQRRLLRQRDRRLSHTGKYYGRIRLGGGWLAQVVLRPFRRHVFPEPAVPDRDAAEWRRLLEEILANPESQTGDLRHGMPGLQVERQVARTLREQLAWTLRGSPHRLAYLACHRQRHRDLPAPLVLGVAERWRTGLCQETMLIRPSPPA